MHVLHVRHHDVGCCDLFGSRLGQHVSVHVDAVSRIFPLHTRDARVTAMATGQRQIGRGTQGAGGHGKSQ